ncbi:hypothetical protein ACU686_26130 [Yinghuangia aomiensis]
MFYPSTVGVLRTTVAYGRAEPKRITTATGTGAAARHMKAVQLALTEMHDAYRAEAGMPPEAKKWTPVTTRYNPRPARTATKPHGTAREGEGWQRWTEPDGTTRYGIASTASPEHCGIPNDVYQLRSVRVVAPADGGPPFAVGKPINAAARWQRADGTTMTPALHQDALLRLPPPRRRPPPNPPRPRSPRRYGPSLRYPARISSRGCWATTRQRRTRPPPEPAPFPPRPHTAEAGNRGAGTVPARHRASPSPGCRAARAADPARRGRPARRRTRRSRKDNHNRSGPPRPGPAPKGTEMTQPQPTTPAPNEPGPAPERTAPPRDTEWREARCPDCGWEIEINRWGDRTVCACAV